MTRWPILLVFVALLSACLGGPGDNTKTSNNYSFINGLWFNGSTFDHVDWYVVNGVLSQEQPKHLDSIIDLKGKFVIPPFAEAHNHNIESKFLFKAQSKIYLRKGIFYVKNPNDIALFSKEINDEIKKKETVDVSFAHGGLTSTGGHPTQIYAFRKRQGDYPQELVFENNAYYYVDSKSDLAEKWQAIMKDEPDFIKTYLLFSETSRPKGLNSTLLSLIVEKAHNEGLRVSTHVETSMDFKIAVAASVDEINHLPGYHIPKQHDSTRYLILDADAKVAKAKGIVVVTTLLASGEVVEWSKPLDYMRSVQKQNLRTLKRNKVKIAIGSDEYYQTSLEEILLLKDLNIFSNLELLKMFCENSAQTIFPERKIGYLKDGYEASFLVIPENPIKNFNTILDINLLVKQGSILQFE